MARTLTLIAVTTTLAVLAAAAVADEAEPEPSVDDVPEWLFSVGASLSRALQGSGLLQSLATPVISRSECALAVPESELAMTLRGCTVIASDTGAESDPRQFWGKIACARDSRYHYLESGGDARPEATGTPQEDMALRRLTVFDGDDYYGERCELGENNHQVGPTAFYREGQRRATFISVRLPDDFPLGTESWQVVMQMKQTQPSANGGGTPVLSLEAYADRWRLRQSDSNGPASDSHELWSGAAQTGTWVRFAFDVTYSQDPSIGRVKVYADLNGDSDFDDSEEQSSTMQTYTLKVETTGGDDRISEGDSIPSHLRTGLYHNPEYGCPAPGGCYVDVDNIQVLGG